MNELEMDATDQNLAVEEMLAQRERAIEWVVRQQNATWGDGWSEDFQRGYDAAVEEIDAIFGVGLSA